MGCFLGCFGGSKDDKRRKNTNFVPPTRNPNYGIQYEPVHVPTTVAVKQDNSEKPINLVADSHVKPEKEPLSLNNQSLNLNNQSLSLSNRGNSEQQVSSATRKKVTFDSNVREYEHISADEEPENIETSEIGGERGVNDKCEEQGKSPSVSESGSTLSSLGSYPPNHRYQNCRESDDEDEDLGCEVSDLDEDEDELDEDDEEVDDNEYCDDDEDFYQRDVPELSTGSCSSMESRTRCPTTRVVSDGNHEPMSDHLFSEIETKTSGFNRGARDRSGYVHSVLNPVENTTQWKAVKAKGTPSHKQLKENFQRDSSLKQSTFKSKSNLDEPKSGHEVAVDASLSTWLMSSLKTPPNKTTSTGLERISSGASLSSYGSNSIRGQEDRPILGALTVEELKQFSASSSPRRSPNRSPDEKPLVGTVGVHWNDKSPIENPRSASSFKGIPNTTSKYREDKRVNWHSTPFETRLERALNRGDAKS